MFSPNQQLSVRVFSLAFLIVALLSTSNSIARAAQTDDQKLLNEFMLAEAQSAAVLKNDIGLVYGLYRISNAKSAGEVTRTFRSFIDDKVVPVGYDATVQVIKWGIDRYTKGPASAGAKDLVDKGLAFLKYIVDREQC